MATSVANIPHLNSTSEAPNLFDGTTRLYISKFSPFAERVLIARNFKGLDHIEVVGIDLADRPSWYVEKVYTIGKVPSLEHNGKVKGESLELLEYLDENFEGPPLFPKDSVKQEAVKELLQLSDKSFMQVLTLLRNKDATKADAEETLGRLYFERPSLDHLEAALGKFEEDGPFFIGQMGVADIAYAPFVERMDLLLPEILQYDMYHGRPRLFKWFQAMNAVDAYTSSKCEPQLLASVMKRILGR